MDEAAFIADEVYDATIPMLAAAPEGRIILMSTPYTSTGFFYSLWHNADGWQRIEFKTADCPRVAKEWLDARRREDPLRYAREYECQFGAADDALFTAEMLDRCVVANFEPIAL
jgi:hypothetical protein